MRLTNCRIVGRYAMPDGRIVNVHKGHRIERGTDILYWLYRGKRILISDAEFSESWKKA